MILRRELCDITELKRYFEIDELIYSYSNGKLEIWLNRIGENKKAEQIKLIPENVLLLIRLYQILGLEPEMTEYQIRLSCI